MTHPSIDFEKLGRIDPERFDRAMALLPEAMANGQYRVRKANDPKSDPHNVDLFSADLPRCDCGDHLWREQLCKHILACLIHLNHPAVAPAIVRWMADKRK